MGGGNDVHKGHKVTAQTLETNVINNLNDVMRMEMMMKVKNWKGTWKHGTWELEEVWIRENYFFDRRENSFCFFFLYIYGIRENPKHLKKKKKKRKKERKEDKNKKLRVVSLN